MRRKMIPEKTTAAIDFALVLKNLMLNLPGHVYWKDINGIYLGCNDRQAQTLGLKFGEEVIGKTDFDLPWQDDLARHFWENDAQVLISGTSKSFEELAIVNGKEAIVWSLKVPLKTNENKIVGVLGISIDITQQKRIEEKLIQAKEAQEAALQTKTRFLKNMRHSIRIPMAGIQGCIRAIRDFLDENKAEEAKEYVEDLDHSSQALLRLLNNALEKLQPSSQLPTQKNGFNLHQVILDVLELNAVRAKQKGLQLNLEQDQKITDLVGDEERVQRIVLELVGNAINFTTEGEVTVKTRLAKESGDRVIVKLIVEDTGCGISSEKQRSIFTAFSPLKPSYQGFSLGKTGLGMLLIKQLVDDLSGEIYLESHEGKGSRFSCVLPFKLPLLEIDRNGDKELTEPIARKIRIKPTRESQPGVALNPPKALRMLLIEDDLIVTKVTLVLLSKLNCAVEAVYDAASALVKLNQNPYDLILLDIGLPDRNGCEVVSEMRSHQTCCNQLTPVVAITAHADLANRKKYLACGMNAVLSKPLSAEDLGDIVRIFSITHG